VVNISRLSFLFYIVKSPLLLYRKRLPVQSLPTSSGFRWVIHGLHPRSSPWPTGRCFISWWIAHYKCSMELWI